jgi:superfamily II helicase
MGERLMQTAAAPIKARADEVRNVARKERTSGVLTSAELAECTCPDWCERDHDRD